MADPRKLHDDELLLLNSLEGVAAFRVLLPLIRALAMFIAGRGPKPQLPEVPSIDSDVTLERARFRILKDSCD